MSERRMFSKSITESDAFLDLPFSTQALYFHLSMSADDEGFINNAKRVLRVCGASEDDVKRLVEKSFLIRFDSGIFVIKHWKINNKIRGDRRKETNYPDEKALLAEKTTGIYSLKTNAMAEAEAVESKKENETENIEKATDVDLPAEETSSDETDSVVKENLTTESNVMNDAEIEEEKAREERAESFEYETMSEPRKSYAETIYDILFSHGLPCANNNLITFTMRDFKIALGEINRLHLHSDEVIQATKNYAEVVELKRKGLSWWNSEQTFNNFCTKNTILRFLPGTYRVEDYLKNKDDAKNVLEDKIQL